MTTYLTSDIRYLINQESFFGSLTCKINQGQLESEYQITIVIIFNNESGLAEFNNEIYYDLLRLLTLKKHRMSKLPSPENSIEPCWYHSKEESEAAFDQTVKKLEEWHKTMVGRILSLQDKSAELRIRGSGTNFYNFIIFYNVL